MSHPSFPTTKLTLFSFYLLSTEKVSPNGFLASLDVPAPYGEKYTQNGEILKTVLTLEYWDNALKTAVYKCFKCWT